MTYTQAVEKACNGDSTGFEFLYDTTKNNKYYLALKYVKDEEAAKDVLQEAYIRAWKNLDKLKEPEKFDSWLAQIVVNTAKNELENAIIHRLIYAWKVVRKKMQKSWIRQ